MSIIIIEGHDLSGKNKIAVDIVQLKGYDLFESINLHKKDIPFWDDKQEKWPYIIQGDTEAALGAMKVFNDFVKIRFHLSEYVYSNCFNRKTIVSFEEVEDKLLEFRKLNKEIYLLYVDIDYDLYVKRYQERGDTLFLSVTSFNIQRELFLEAYSKSRLLKTIVSNTGTAEDNKKIADFILHNIK